jgi:1-acyl-sn-glycerol-3-phosphate acyltransferase
VGLPRYDIDATSNRDPKRFEQLLPWVDALRRYHRAEVTGLERIPEGPALYVGNHNGALYSVDTFFWVSEIFRRRGMVDVPFGLGHSLPLSMAPLHQFLIPLGAIRACHENAHKVFAEGHKALVYPGGDEDAMRPWRLRNRVRFAGRAGFMRLALREGVPVIPVAALGAHGTLMILHDFPRLARRLPLLKKLRIKVFPISLALPWGVMVGPLPYIPWPSKIRVQVLEPMHFARSGEEAANDEAYVRQCADEVEATIQGAMDAMARG